MILDCTGDVDTDWDGAVGAFDLDIEPVDLCFLDVVGLPSGRGTLKIGIGGLRATRARLGLALTED